MRLLSLALRPYGAFTDTAYEFEAADPGGFHLVHGPNGAGKSTTLEAIRSVLFGMRPGVHDHHFPSRELRLGARLRRSDGSEIEYWRRTSRNHPLWSATDEDSLAEDELAPFLGGLDRGRFESLYGLDLATLVAGGDELLRGQGELGRALYGAGLGGTTLARVIEQLDEEIAGLYTDRSQKARINVLSREYRTLDRELREASLSATAFDAQRRDLRRAERAAEKAVAQRADLRREIAHLERLARCVAPLVRRERLAAERAAHATLEPLSPEVAREFGELDEARERLGREAAERDERARERAAEIAELRAGAPSELLQSANEIRDIVARRGAYADALERVEASEAARDAARIRRDRAQAPAGGSPRIDLEDSRAALDALSLRRAEAEREAKALGKQLGRAESALRAAERAAAAEPGVEELGIALTELGPFEGTLDELERLVPPPPEAVARREATEAQRREATGAIAHERRSIDEAVQVARETIERLSASGSPPPTAEELERARAERDAAWGEIAATGAVEPEGRAAYESLVADADGVADRLHADSERSAELAAARRGLESAAERSASLAAEERALAERAAEEDAAWAELWARAGFEPLEGATMRAWCERRAALLEALRVHRRAISRAEESARAEVEELVAAHRDALTREGQARLEWKDWAHGLGIDPAAGEARARARIQEITESRDAAEELTRLEPEAAGLRQTVTEVEASAASACDRLRLPVEARGTTLDRIDALRDALEGAQRASAEVAGLEREARAEAARADVAAGRLEEIVRGLEALRERTGEASVDTLRERVAVSERLSSLDEDLLAIRSEVEAALPGASLDEVRAELGERTAEDFADEIEANNDRIDRIDAELVSARETVGTLRAVVESEGSEKAAELAEERARLAATLSDGSERYARAQLAREILDQEMERYRAQHQGPLLRRAGELLETLTLGAYVGLVASENERDQKVMQARRPSGASVPVKGMSTGTRDQLYLALRIASVEQMIRTTEPMPFIADDLFVNFDDARTEAALRALSELARSTQVIVFSHHEGVRTSALGLADDGVDVRVHRLPGESERSAPPA